MSGYTKLFNSILDSTVWLENSDTKVVWITMMAMANREGIVNASIPSLARRAGIGVEACQQALGKFLAVDPYSRTPDRDGRRIEAVNGGWRILNYAKYRHMLSDDDRRERGRIRTQRWRQAKAEVQAVTECHTASPPVTSVTDCHKCHKRHGDDIAEAEAYIANTADAVLASGSYVFQSLNNKKLEKKINKEKKEKIAKTSPPSPELPGCINPQTWADYLEMRRRIRKPATPRAQQLAITALLKLRDQGEDPQAVLEQSILNSWQGLFAVSKGARGNGETKTQRMLRRANDIYASQLASQRGTTPDSD